VRKLHLGQWRCPSGNAVDVYLTLAAGDGPQPTDLSAEWDCFPPSQPDAHHWQATILPEVAEAIVKVTGLRTLVVTV